MAEEFFGTCHQSTAAYALLSLRTDAVVLEVAVDFVMLFEKERVWIPTDGAQQNYFSCLSKTKRFAELL